MIWNDTIAEILTAINASSVYNTANSTTPTNLGLIVYNQAQDWLCMYKPWRDLRVETTLALDANRAITMPSDFGCVIMVYTDPGNIGKPMFFYSLNHNDVARRYKEEVTVDSVTGARTIKFVFPSAGFLPSSPTVCYSKVLAKATQSEVDAATKKSFFPINIMLAVSKMILQDYYGVPANQDPSWIIKRVQEELRMLEGYAYNTNSPLDLSIKDQFGNPVFIQGASLDGTAPRLNRPSPFLPSTLFSGGTW